MSEDIETLRRILKENHTIAVVGLSANWYRESYFAAKYLRDHGYRILPINPIHKATAALDAGCTLQDT